MTLHSLEPALNKLVSHSLLDSMDRQAFLDLPHRVTSQPAHAYLRREGDRGDSFTVLLSGFAYASKITGTGARQILSVHVPGDMLDLHSGMLPRVDHCVQTSMRTDVAHIAQRDILDLAEGFPNIARALWRDTLMDASISREWLLNVGRRCAQQRVAHFLCELAIRQSDAPVSDGYDFQLPITQEQLGDVVGLTAVHVNRTMQGLRAGSVFRQELRQITVTNWNALQAVGDFNPDYLQRA